MMRKRVRGKMRLLFSAPLALRSEFIGLGQPPVGRIEVPRGNDCTPGTTRWLASLRHAVCLRSCGPRQAALLFANIPKPVAEDRSSPTSAARS